MSQPIRIALIGYGFSARTFHAPLIRALPGSGFDLTVVSSSRPDDVRAELPSVRVVASPEEAIAAEVDLVVITSPNAVHADQAIAALRAGKHVVVEKPFTITLDEARRVAVVARESARVLSVFQNRRWDSDFLAAQALIKSGALGRVTHFESHFDRFRPQVRDRWRERGSGSGLWYDLGPHLVDQALQLFGLPDRVTANFAMQREGSKAVDWLHVLLDYGETRVVLHASVLVAGPFRRMAIHSAAGTWIKHGLDVQESQLLAGMAPGDAGWGEDPERARWFDGTSGEGMELAVPSGDYRQFYLRLEHAIARGGPTPVTPAQAIAVMAVIDAGIRSVESGRTCQLALSDDERSAFARE